MSRLTIVERSKISFGLQVVASRPGFPRAVDFCPSPAQPRPSPSPLVRVALASCSGIAIFLESRVAVLVSVTVRLREDGVTVGTATTHGAWASQPVGTE